MEEFCFGKSFIFILHIVFNGVRAHIQRNCQVEVMIVRFSRNYSVWFFVTRRDVVFESHVYFSKTVPNISFVPP